MVFWFMWCAMCDDSGLANDSGVMWFKGSCLECCCEHKVFYIATVGVMILCAWW
ncbi:hypothetical protein M758_4G114800 [Ceratodon purpureus]|nr:hypothetical protein M758_4G114800 [Ceratodon purpureus]